MNNNANQFVLEQKWVQRIYTYIYIYIRRPLGATRLWRISLSHRFAVLMPCWFTISVWSLIVLSHEVWETVVLRPERGKVTTPDVRSLNSGVPPGNPEHPSIFKPVSRATKAMKIDPKATQNHEKSTLESQEIQFLRKLIFAIPSMPNACFSNPRHPNLNPKTDRKNNLEIDLKKTTFLVQKYLKSSQNGSPKSTKNQ